MGFDWHDLLTAVLGSFALAFVCKDTGRDPRIGGIAGLVLGYFIGWIAVAWVAGWLYIYRLNPRLVRRPTPWWAWWRS